MIRAKNIISIISLLAFGVIVYFMFAIPNRAKKEAFKLSFSGTVISTLKGEKRDHRITVEILKGESRCFILISPIKDKRLYPQYRDSIFKESGSDIMYLKKDQKTEIIAMDDIHCLNIDCHEENQR